MSDVTVELGDRRWEGHALDLSDTDVTAEQILEAIRSGPTQRPSTALSVHCPSPTPVHEHVGRHPPTSFDLYEALVAAARSRGVTAPSEPRLAQVRDALAEADPESVGLEAAKRRIAETGTTEDRLRERVATLRGRMEARRRVDAETETVANELEAAIRELTEVETERIAAQQRLDAAARRACRARETRERRFRLEDEAANLRRRVRHEFVTAVYDRFAAALAALPGDADAGSEPDEYDGDVQTAALGVARIADVRAPLVLDGCRFGSAAETATRLRAPVIRL